MQTNLEINDFINFFRRRKKSFLLPFLLIFSSALIISYKLSPIFLSESTIIVEGQQIPEDYIGTSPTSYVEERIQSITKQIMSRKNLMEIIDKFDLYSKLKNESSEFDVLNKFKKDISLDTIDTNVHNRTSGREIITTIAFTISYQGNDPKIVKDVTNELASLYVKLDTDEREKNTSSTAKFLELKMKELQNKIKSYEKKISEFKSLHLYEMPEYNVYNIQSLANLEKESDRIQIQLRALRDRREDLQKWIAGISPYKVSIINGNDILLHPKDRLRMLRIQLMDLKSTLSDKHPDIKRLERLIQELEYETNNLDILALKKDKLKEIQYKISRLEGTASNKHPDMRRLKKEAKDLQKEIDEIESGNKLQQSKEAQPDNPSYLHLREQILAVDTEIQSLNDQKDKTLKGIKDFKQKIANAPLVERDYNEITRDYETAKQRYRELSDDVIKAKFAEAIDKSQKTTRFKILEPAYLPKEPIKPNKKAIILLGTLIGGIFGFLFAIFRENMDNSIKSEKDINNLLGVPVFAEIPVIYRKKNMLYKRTILSCTIFLIILSSLVLFHIYISPLNIVLERYSELINANLK